MSLFELRVFEVLIGPLYSAHPLSLNFKAQNPADRLSFVNGSFVKKGKNLIKEEAHIFNPLHKTKFFVTKKEAKAIKERIIKIENFSVIESEIINPL